MERRGREGSKGGGGENREVSRETKKNIRKYEKRERSKGKKRRLELRHDL